MIKTVLWPRFARAALLEHLSPLPGIELVSVKDEAALIEQLPSAEVLVIPASLYSEAVAKQLKANAPRLKFMQLLTAGYDSLLARGAPDKLMIASAGDSWSPGVAEHAIALMLAMVKQLPSFVQAQGERQWSTATHGPRMTTLSGRTLLILGYGSIGREAATRARGLGMRVVGVSRSGKRDGLLDEAVKAEHFDAALANADVLLIAVPSSNATRHLINAQRLALCKPTLLLVNVARGEIVDQTALAHALSTGQIGGAALDVTSPEPLPSDHPLWQAPNLLITPHVAGSTGAAGEARLARHAASNLKRYVDGLKPEFLIDLNA